MKRRKFRAWRKEQRKTMGPLFIPALSVVDFDIYWHVKWMYLGLSHEQVPS